MTAAVTYRPSVATITELNPDSGVEIAVTITLMPQTIAFTPSVNGCGSIPGDLRCLFQPFNITSGAICYANFIVASTGVSPPTACFPNGYNYLWRPISSTFQNLPRLAYPGSACINGWTTACITTVALQSAERMLQTWCCPPGEWSCLSVAGLEIPYRDCVSVLNTPTEVWVNNVATGSDGKISTDSSSWRKVILSDFPPSAQIRVKHAIIPLDGRLPTDGNEAAHGSLSTGAIGGIVVAIVVVTFGFITSALFVRKRRKRRLAQSRMHTRELGSGDKRLGFDTKPELPGQDSEIRELQSLSLHRAELSAQTKPSEMDASAPPVELPS